MEQLCLGRGLAVVSGSSKSAAACLVANQESLSPREGMVADVLSVVHTLSCRLCGLRRYERALKDELGGGGR